jgi:hypothetical protein
MELEPVLKRRFCDQQGCFRETDPLSLLSKCFRHSGLFDKDQRCDFAECDNWIASRGRCEAHGGVVKHCKHGLLKEECRACHYGGSGFCKKHGRIKGTCRECDAATIDPRLCQHCKDWPDSRVGMKRYNGMCYRCFSHLTRGEGSGRTKKRTTSWD